MKLGKGTEIKVFLKNGFHYQGIVQDTSEFFLTIHDHKTNRERGIAYTEITNYEVIQE